MENVRGVIEASRAHLVETGGARGQTAMDFLDAALAEVEEWETRQTRLLNDVPEWKAECEGYRDRAEAAEAERDKLKEALEALGPWTKPLIEAALGEQA